MHRSPGLARSIDHKNIRVIIRVCAFSVKDSRNRTYDDTDEEKPRSQPEPLAIDTLGDFIIVHPRPLDLLRRDGTPTSWIIQAPDHRVDTPLGILLSAGVAVNARHTTDGSTSEVGSVRLSGRSAAHRSEVQQRWSTTKAGGSRGPVGVAPARRARADPDLIRRAGKRDGMDGAKRVGRLVVHHDADDRHEGTLVIGAETDSAPAPPL